MVVKVAIKNSLLIHWDLILKKIIFLQNIFRFSPSWSTNHFYGYEIYHSMISHWLLLWFLCCINEKNTICYSTNKKVFLLCNIVIFFQYLTK